MFWLIAHMWLLLLLAFLLGLLIGWWIWARGKDDGQESAGRGAEAVPQTVAAVASSVEQPKPQHTGTMPTLYETPLEGAADDLKKISGIGPAYEKTLNGIGVWYYRQIAGWSEEQVTWMDHKLDFPGRIERENWQEQAQELQRGGETAFAKRYSKGDTPSSYDNAPGKRAGGALMGADFMDDVRRYDPAASLEIVEKIVAYCGASLKTRDGALVACSDKKEREGIRTHFGMKVLKLIPADADAAIEAVCHQMKADRNKSTVTFYYLMAKHTDTLNAL